MGIVTRTDSRLTRHLVAFALTSPAIAAALALRFSPPFSAMLFDGGPEVFLANVSEALLFPYVAVFMLALGTLLPPWPEEVEQSRLQSLDVHLIRFFTGAALLVIGGFGLGLVKLLHGWITAAIFCAVLYAYFLRFPSLFRRVFEWCFARHELQADARGEDVFVRGACTVLRIFGLGVVVVFLLTSGVLLNLYSSDDMQLYFPYLAEVRRQHSIWLDPAHPVYSDFLIGRGNGAHLFFASFTNPYFGQIISVVYLVVATLLVRQVVSLIMPRDPDTAWRAARAVLPDCAMILVLASAIIGVDTAKYHTQTNAFLLFSSWGSLLLLFTARKQARWLFHMLVPVVIAIPVMLPQYQALVTVSIATAMAAMYLAGRRDLIRYGGTLVVIGLTAMAASLAFNQLYIGVAELNPAWLFLRFSNPEVFSQWSSPSLIQYLQFTQELPSRFASFGHTELRSLLIQLGYVCAIAYPLFLVFTRISFADRLRGACSAMTPAACIFIGAFLCIYAVGKTISLLTTHSSLMRLLQFQSIYLPLFCVVALVFTMALLFHRNGVPGNHLSRKWEIWLSIIPALLCAAVVVRVLIVGFGFRESGRLALVLLVLLVIIPFLARARRWATGPALAPTSAALPSRPAVWDGSWWALLFVLLAALSLCLASWSVKRLYHDALSSWLGSPAAVRAVRYFFGMEGLIESVPKEGWTAFNFNRCIEIAQAVPGEARVLPLNANYKLVPCYNSPLLPRGKIVHHYESTLAPKFDGIALGSAEHAASILLDSGIEYFYFQKEDNDFFGPAFGELFSTENLQRKFGIHRETEGFIILTWRNSAVAPLSMDQAASIDALRSHGCEHPLNPTINNCRGFFKLKKWHEQKSTK